MGRDTVGHSLANSVERTASLALVDKLEPHWSKVAKSAAKNSAPSAENSAPSAENSAPSAEFSPVGAEFLDSKLLPSLTNKQHSTSLVLFHLAISCWVKVH